MRREGPAPGTADAMQFEPEKSAASSAESSAGSRGRQGGAKGIRVRLGVCGWGLVNGRCGIGAQERYGKGAMKGQGREIRCSSIQRRVLHRVLSRVLGRGGGREGREGYSRAGGG